MSTAELTANPAALTRAFAIADEAIEQMAAEYLPLVIADLNDKKGYELVHSARMAVRGKRVEIEKTRKKLNEDALAWQRTVNTEAKRLTSLIEPIESHLEREENAWNEERARIKHEAEEKRQLAIRARLQLLADCNLPLDAVNVEAMADEEWQKFITSAQQKKRERDEQQRREAEERKAREEAEAAERRKSEAAAAEARAIEEEKLAAERAELDRQRKEQAEAQAKIDAEKKRLADEQAKREREAELERAKAEAAERAKRESEEQARRDAEAAKAKAEAEERERQRIEALRPDHEKLLAVAKAVRDIQVPAMSAEAFDVVGDVKMLLVNTATRIEAAANRLVQKAA